MTISEAELAKLAGVSRKTVYNAIYKPQNVGDKKRDLILKLIEKHQFKPNYYMSQLRKGTNRYLCVVCPAHPSQFYQSIIDELVSICQDTGYEMVVTQKADTSAFMVEAVASRQFAGYLLIGSGGFDPKHVGLLHKANVPLVALGSQLNEYGVPIVTWNVEQVIALVLEAVSRHGHRSLGLVAPSSRDETSGINKHDLRSQIIMRQASKYGIEVRPEWMFPGADELDVAAQVGERLRALDKRPTALFGFNDITAIAVMSSCQRAGLRIPEDLSIVGLDGIPFGELIYPRLTTVSQPAKQYGEKMFAVLKTMLEDEKFSYKKSKDLTHILPSVLVERESLAAP